MPLEHFPAEKPAEGAGGKGSSLLSAFDLVAGLLTLTAIFAWLNHRYLRLPANIGLLVMGLAASLLLISIEYLVPEYLAVRRTDACHPPDRLLRRRHERHAGFPAVRRRPACGSGPAPQSRYRRGHSGDGRRRDFDCHHATGLFGAAALLGLPVSFAWALVFGALIAPTDPVAVLTTLKSANVPEMLEMDMSGEALFNDGIGVVIFAIALQARRRHRSSALPEMARPFAARSRRRGASRTDTGYIAYRALRVIDDYSIEVLISLALVIGTYALANNLHISGPIAVVVAGVLIGNQGRGLRDERCHQALCLRLLDADGRHTQRRPVPADRAGGARDRLRRPLLTVWLVAMPLVLLARLVAVGGPVPVLSRWKTFAQGTIPVLTWGGVRGGISVALALSLPRVRRGRRFW